MAALIDAWKLFYDEFTAQRLLIKKRREYVALTGRNIDIPLLEALSKSVARQQPGFYTTLKFTDGTTLEFGVREGQKQPPRRQEGETF